MGRIDCKIVDNRVKNILDLKPKIIIYGVKPTRVFSKADDKVQKHILSANHSPQCECGRTNTCSFALSLTAGRTNSESATARRRNGRCQDIRG